MFRGPAHRGTQGCHRRSGRGGAPRHGGCKHVELGARLAHADGPRRHRLGRVGGAAQEGRADREGRTGRHEEIVNIRVGDSAVGGGTGI